MTRRETRLQMDVILAYFSVDNSEHLDCLEHNICHPVNNNKLVTSVEHSLKNKQ